MHYYPLTVLAASWVFWIWETYLDIRQFKVYKSTKEVPLELKYSSRKGFGIDNETFAKSKSYSIDKAKFGFFSSIFSQLQSTLTIYFFLIPYFWGVSQNITARLGSPKSDSIGHEILQSVVFLFTTSLITTFINLPLSIYNTFVIEQKHGFNKQTAGFYAWDKLKMFMISFMISTPVVSAMVYIVRNGGPYFFLYLWIFLFVVVCILMLFQGEIAALFDKFTSLPEGKLRGRIEELAQEVQFPLTNIFVVEGSKRSTHSNAYQSGLFNRKRVVLYDTLIKGYYDNKDNVDENTKEPAEEKEKEKEKEKDKEKEKGCDDDEVIAVLCHEFGHWYYSHLWKHLTFAQVNYFLMFVIFSKFYRDPSFYEAFGFVDEMPVIIGFALLMMVLTPYNELLSFISTYLTRLFEYQSDGFAAMKGYGEKLKTALVKLNIDNLGFPVHDELYSKFNHSHPTLIQRIRALEKKVE